MRGLKTFLWIAAIACLLSALGVLLPMSALDSIGKVFGAEAMPDSPLFAYAVRTMSATYVAIGVFFLILALNPAKYAPLVTFAGVASVFVGVVCAVTGVTAKMPVQWFAGDSLFCTGVGILILVFQRRVLTAR